MSKTSPLKWVVFVCAFTIALPTLANKAEDAVDYRQGMMMGIGWNIGAMGAMVKGTVPFDAKKFEFMAGRAATLAPMPLEGFTPETKAQKSHAKAKIWDNWSDFEKRMKDLEAGTKKLAEVAQGGDEGAMKKQFGDTVKVCKSCHDEYQVKR